MTRSWLIPAALVAALAASPALAAADDACELTISGDDEMQFDSDELRVPASCDEVTLTLKHVGEMDIDVMGHNWVLTDSDDFEEVAQEGQSTSLENDYVPEGDDRVIAHTEVIGGGESTSITFSTDGLAGRDMTFFCSFPGHYAMMNGRFIVEEEGS